MKIAHNKGVYGEKRRSFLSEGVALCIHHGLHENWYYNENNNQLSCRICILDRKSRYKKKKERVFSKFITYSKSRCKKWLAEGRIVEHNITLRYIIDLYINQGGMCAISGLDLDEDVMSLDRIDSSLGYIEGNIQWVHFDVNRMKSNLNEAYFIGLCKAIANK